MARPEPLALEIVGPAREVGGHPAVDQDCHPRDVLGLVGREKGDRVPDVLRAAKPRHEVVAFEGVECVLRFVREDGRTPAGRAAAR